MTDKKFKISDIKDFVKRVYFAECHNCGKRIQDDSKVHVAEEAYKQGFRKSYKTDVLLCSECYELQWESKK